MSETFMELIEERCRLALIEAGARDVLSPRVVLQVLAGLLPVPGRPFQYVAPTLEQIAATEDLTDRAIALLVNEIAPQCARSIELLESVRHEWIVGPAAYAQAYGPPWAPLPKYPNRLPRFRRPEGPSRLASLFDLFPPTEGTCDED